METIEHRARISTYSSITALLTLAAAFGCSSEAEHGSNVGSAYENLTTDLSICVQSGQDCLAAADGDVPKVQVCKDELASCREAVHTAKQEVHDALRACVTTARECVASVGDGGPAAYLACRQQFHACVQAALPPLPPLPPCAQALQQCLSTSADAGPSARRQCFEQFRTCAEANLPPCMQGLATCIDSGGDFRSCIQEAQQCRQYRLSHDGGIPPNP